MSFLVWAIILFVVLSDQVSKFLVSQTLRLNESSAVIENFFHLTLVRNTGAAFGIFKNQTLFFIIISFIAVIAILVFIKSARSSSPLRDVGFALMLGGAFGNLIDRFRFGYVIDFLDFRVWPVFNIADSAITIGTFLVIVSLCIRSSSK